jgi:hypothetical protein
MLPTAWVEHELPGRIRLRIASRRGDRPFFHAIVQHMKEHPGVTSLHANVDTGSVLICHDGAFGDVAALGDEHSLFTVQWPQPAQVRLRRREERDGPASGANLAGAAAGLSALGVYQAARGRLFGSATESFWQAYGAHQLLGRPGVAGALAAIGVYQLAAGALFGAASSLFFYALTAQHLARIQAAGPEPQGPGPQET